MEEPKKTYQQILSEKRKIGNAPVSWKFFEDLHEIFARDPKYTPVATAFSSGNCREAGMEGNFPLQIKNSFHQVKRNDLGRFQYWK